MNVNQEHFNMQLIKLTHFTCWLNVEFFFFKTQQTSHDYAVYLIAGRGVTWAYSKGFIYFMRGPEKPLYYYWPDIQSLLCLSSSPAGPEPRLSTSSPVFVPETWAATKSPSLLHQPAAQTLNDMRPTNNQTQAQAWRLSGALHILGCLAEEKPVAIGWNTTTLRLHSWK